MSQIVRIITRYSNGLTVYENQGYVRSARRTGHLQSVQESGVSLASKPDMSAANRALAARLGYPVSDGPDLEEPGVEAAAQAFFFWLEDQYELDGTMAMSRSLAYIRVPKMPPPPVLDLAVKMLRQRGWEVFPPSRREDGVCNIRSRVVAMRLTGY
jgi:hypothetical protein